MKRTKFTLASWSVTTYTVGGFVLHNAFSLCVFVCMLILFRAPYLQKYQLKTGLTSFPKDDGITNYISTNQYEYRHPSIPVPSYNMKVSCYCRSFSEVVQYKNDSYTNTIYIQIRVFCP